MTNEEQKHLDSYRAEQQLMNSLLTSLHEDDATREDRVAATMQKFESTNSPVSPAVPRRRVNRSVQWLSVTAAIMIAGFFWNQFLQPTQLAAAVDRVETAAVEPVTRIYDLQLYAELPNGSTFSKRGRIYTKSTDLFVVTIGDRKRQMVFGSDGDRDWFVVGRRNGYLSEARDNWPRTPFVEERMHRFMLANECLQSLSANYEVTLLDEPAPKSVDRTYTALLGKRIVGDRKSPKEVRIWADRETGVPLVVNLKWDQPKRFKPQEVSMEFVGEKPVGESFYTLGTWVDRE